MNYTKCFFLILLMMCTSPAFTQTTQLNITVNKVNAAKGNIRLVLFNKSIGFPSDYTKAYKALVLPAAKGQVMFNVGIIPPGDYAIAVYHDANNDNQLNTNFVGMPKEGFAFSTNYKPVFRAPRFNEVKVAVVGKMEIAVDLMY